MENVNRVTQVPEEFMRIMSEFRLTTALREEVGVAENGKQTWLISTNYLVSILWSCCTLDAPVSAPID